MGAEEAMERMKRRLCINLGGKCRVEKGGGLKAKHFFKILFL